ncbi:MAG: trigger factor [Dehalococcoidia bacterium]|nr:trigger factor [Dehalococcoidia bacterium]
MKVTTEQSTEERQAVLTIELDPPELEGYLERASKKLAQRLKVPGFRPGKAPRHIIERTVGKEGLLQEAMDALLPEVTQKALEQEKLEWSAPPNIEISQKEPLVLKATVPLTPILDLGDYRSVRVPDEPAQADGAQVDRALEGLQREQGVWEPADRPVAAHDLVVLDLAGTVDGQPFFKQEAMPFIVVPDSDVPLPGFASAIVGVAPQQQKEFDLPIPESYPEKRVAGKTCHLTVKVNEVKSQRLPELNDEFAKGVGQGFESLEALKAQLSKNIGAAEEDRARRAYEEKVVQALLAQAKVVLPPLLVGHETDHLLQDRAETLARQGVKLEDFLQRAGKTLEQFREDMKEQTRTSLLRSLVLRKVADEENIQVDQEELASDIADLARQVAAQSGGKQRLTGNDRNREMLARIQRNRKAMERLVVIAQGKAEQAPATVAQTGEAPTNT